jgi:alkanesulfonate monooxygenase SsuD/methylene tetrahydromethanopterin reductase-like flavin-dependent oxidoreductase (luciferase family)
VSEDGLLKWRALWDSWEDDAVIKDVATGRFLDNDKVHHVRFEGASFSVIGPLITPRPPQGQVVVIAAGGHATFIGTPGQIADNWAHYVRTRAVDGFNITPTCCRRRWPTSSTRSSPAPQDRGVYRTEYEGATLREYLTLPSLRPAIASRQTG